MQIRAINSNLKNIIPIKAEHKNKAVKADFQNETIPNYKNISVPAIYYSSNISFGATINEQAFEYVRRSQFEHLKRLVNEHPSVLKAKAGYGYTLLHELLTRYNDRTPKMLEYLISFPETDINAKNSDNNPPLYSMIAGSDKHSDKINEAFDILYSTGKLDLNIKCNSDTTLLLKAIEEGKYKFAKKLLTIPEIDINTPDCKGWTPFMRLCRNSYQYDNNSEGSSLELVKDFLARKDLKLDLKNKDGNDAILLAEDYPHFEIVDMINEFIENNAKEEGEKNFNKETLSPINNIYSVKEISNETARRIRSNDIEGLKNMLECTPLINLDDDGEVMKSAFGAHNTELMEILIDYKNNKQPKMIEQYTKERQEFINSAMQNFSYNELKEKGAIIMTEDGFKMLMSKPEFNPNDIIRQKTLFEISVDLDTNGNIAKEILSKYEDVETSNVLKLTSDESLKNAIKRYEEGDKYKIKLGNLKQRLSDSATSDAALKDLQIFIKEQPSEIPDISDNNGNNAILVASAASDKNIESVILDLLKLGLSVKAKNDCGQNALMIAVESAKGKEKDKKAINNVISNLEYLLSKGMSINAADNEKRTLFHYICETKSPELLKWALNKEINVFIADNNGKRGAAYLQTAGMKEIYNKFIAG